MPFNFRLNLQSLFRRLGIQTGARLPQLEDNVQMTMQITDLSRLIPAPIEPRGVCSVNLAALAANFGVLQLQALSAGGVFIENILLRSSNPLPRDNFQINVTTDNLLLPIAININIGGLQILSRATAGFVLFTPQIGAAIQAPTGTQAISIPLGIFVPNQFFFTIRGHTINSILDVSLIYRELPSVEEVG